MPPVGGLGEEVGEVCAPCRRIGEGGGGGVCHL